jgi:type I restriction enzyme S subunit
MTAGANKTHVVALPPGWAMSTVAQVGAVRLGRQRTPSRQSGDYPTRYLRAANITTEGLDLREVLEMDFDPVEREVFSLRPGDVLLAEASGSAAQVGRSAIWNDELPGCCYQNTVIRFRPHAVSPEYALAVFHHYAGSGVFERAARGVGIQHLGASRFAELPFAVPPAPEQHRIAQELGRRVSESKQAEASLRSAIVRITEQTREVLAAAALGGLVEAEAVIAARERRPFEIASVLLSREPSAASQASLFHPSGEAAEPAVQLLPAGWVWTTTAAVGDLKLGRQKSFRHERGDHPTPYLRVANVHEDHIDFDDLTLMNFTPQEQAEYALRRGDLLLNSGQSPELVGRPALIRREIPLVCFQNHLIRFRPKSFLDSEYALLVFRHYLHTGVFRAISKWSTNLATLGVGELGRLRFPLPPPAEQARIVAEAKDRLEASREQEVAVRASLDRLAELRRELLGAAVAGTLVPQDPHDEPATGMLQRLGPPPPEPVPARPPKLKEPKKMTTARTSRTPAPKKALGDVLRGAQRPIRLPELFAQAGYDRDSTEEVERFYLVLRQELGRTIRKVAGDGENALLEVTTDAT